MFILLSCGQEAGVPGPVTAAWNDDCLGHGGFRLPRQKSQGESVRGG